MVNKYEISCSDTKFFHAVTTARKKVNKIEVLFDDEGNRCVEQEGMCNIVHEYFTKLFTGNEDTADLMNFDSPKRVTSEQNEKLISDFSFSEFTLALKQMHPDKVPGPDGLNPAFFSEFLECHGY